MAGGQSSQDVAARADAVRQRVTLSSVIGADVKLRRQGRELTGLCPFHAEKNDGAFMVNDAKALYKCFSCGAAGDVIDYVRERKGLDFMGALRMLEADAGIDFRDARQRAEFDRAREKRAREQLDDERRRRANAFNFWLNAAAGKGTPAERYLRGRGIDFDRLGHWPGAIRYRHDAWCAEVQQKLPCMATAIYSLDGQFLACHRTYLAYGPGGWSKAALNTPKKVLGDFYGGAIPLWKGDSRAALRVMPAGQLVAMSEGIEDGLSAAIGEPKLRVLAAVSLDNIGNVLLPPQAGDLILLCQRDGDVRMARAAEARARGDEAEAAQHERAARQIEAALERAIAKQRAQAAEQGAARDVRLAWPAWGFKDFNDQLRGVRMAGVAA